uniref:Oxygen-evolving enhancer protein 3, chloroplastic n=1 Tax=Araucaria cunninghamii TaxID=56994 RepID=A0A0D6R181_ARACU
MQLSMQRTCGAGVGQTAERPAHQRLASRAVVRAEPQEASRRQAFGALLAGLAVIGTQSPARAIDVFDDRKVRETGYDLIYEAREIELPQSVRDGLEQARKDEGLTKKRIKESERRIDTALDPFIKKKYWTSAREELRLQVGTLRFDLNTLSAKLDKTKRKAVGELKKTFLKDADNLDFAIRQKDQDKASEALVSIKGSLDKVLTSVM